MANEIDRWPPRAVSVPGGLAIASALAIEYAATGSPAAALAQLLFGAAIVFVLPRFWRRGRKVLFFAAQIALVGLVAFAFPVAFAYRSYVADAPASPVLFLLACCASIVVANYVAQHSKATRLAELSESLTRQGEDARLLALRSHLDPHFLFNTLGAIAEWCQQDANVAEAALLELADMLRTLFDGVRAPLWPLSKELALAAAVQRLHAIRDPQRYAYTQSLPSLSQVQIPPLILLPLIENAYTHGTGATALEAEETGETLQLRVLSAGALAAVRPSGTGLDTVRERLALAFGDSARLRIEEIDGPRVRVSITLQR
ncbi:MAG: histidine kinase [Myxococcota bacterium]